jgi:hypothetical protein
MVRAARENISCYLLDVTSTESIALAKKNN